MNSHSPREQRLTCRNPHGNHRIAFSEWGDPRNARVLLCVHGLTRNRHDFDEFAATMQSHYRVLCPDMVGRGQSDFLKSPEDYTYPLYLSDIKTVLEHLKISEIDWVGTSMGGIIGMFLAAEAKTPIRRLVINDVGPRIPKEAISRIASYAEKMPSFSDLESLEKYLRRIYSPFGPLTDEQWRNIARYSSKKTESDQFTLNYDPAILAPIKEGLTQDIQFWDVWDKITAPTLVLRGENSDLLSSKTLQEMKERRPEIQTIEFSGVGHAPMLMAENQIRPVKEWLLEQ